MSYSNFFKKIVFFLFAVSTLSGCVLKSDPDLLAGFVANQLCSRHFVTGESIDYIKTNVIPRTIDSLVKEYDVNFNVDKTDKIVSVSLDKKNNLDKKEGLIRVSVYRDGVGCTLALNKSVRDIQNETVTPFQVTTHPGDDFEISDKYPNISLEHFFDNPQPTNYSDRRNTFAVVVIKNGKIIAEQYDKNHNSDMPMLSWSMAKTLTGLLAGVLYDKGSVNLSDVVLKKTGATLDDVMHMSSGLKWSESTKVNSEDLLLWYRFGDSVKFVKSLDREYQPGKYFRYATGTTQLLAGFIADHVKNTNNVTQSVYDFYQRDLFAPLGIKDAFFEFDETGNFRGGGRAFLKPRDWAKIGQLFINRGQWNGKQVVSSEWIDYMITPNKECIGIACSAYGGQLWLNAPDSPYVPDDVVSLRGLRGQNVVIIPSENLVVVRLGAYGYTLTSNQVRANNILMKDVAKVISQTR